MALFPPVDSVLSYPKLVSSSQLQHQKNNFQREITPDKVKSLKDLYAQKSQSHLCSYSAESNQYIYRHRDFCSDGLQSKYLTSQTKDLTSQTKALPVKSVGGQKEGVDRACPLKPVFHHKGMSVPVVKTAQLGTSPYMEEPPNSRPSSLSKGTPPAGSSTLAAALSPRTAEPKQSASYLYRRESAYILKLEADGRNMEEEIRKKEALLREKLRRTEELLRRIQREKELVGAEERKDREAEKTHEQKAARHPEVKTVRVAIRPDDGVFGGVQSAEATIPKPGTTFHSQELAMGKLKKERLVAGNSKIRDRVPMERLASSSKLSPKHTPSPCALSDRDSGCHLSAEVLHVQNASAVEPEGLGQCSFCGRKFLCTRLEKHMSICRKSQGSRKAFDSRKARARGTALEQYQQRESSERPQNKPPSSNWKEKHTVLIQTLCQTRQVQQVLSKGGKVSDLPPLPPIENPDYVACPHCRRRFAPRAGERHIPACKNIKSRPPPPPRRRQC